MKKAGSLLTVVSMLSLFPLPAHARLGLGFFGRVFRKLQHTQHQLDTGMSGYTACAQEYEAPTPLPYTGYASPSQTVRVEATGNLDTRQREKPGEAARILDNVLNNPTFALRVLSYRGGEHGFSDTGLSNAEVLARLRSQPVLLNVSLYGVSWWHRKTVAQTFVGQMAATKVDRWWFKHMTPAELAGTLAHEWMHNLGFEHYSEFGNSVPYAIGDLVEETAEHG